MYEAEYQAFSRMIEGKPMKWRHFLVLLWGSVTALLEMCLRYIPGGFGYKLRGWYYKLRLKHLGKNVLIDVGVFINGPKNVSIGDYVWVDANCRLEAMLGTINIGKRVHIAPFTIIAAREPVVIADYVGISAGVKIYANSERPFGGKRMSGPMVPEKDKAFYTQKIVLAKDSFVGTNSVLLPGAYLGEGSVVGANSLVKGKVAPWTIVAGPNAKRVGKREKVTALEI